ncbi:alpha-(1,3)-fucosyltransferase C-like [Amblyomma americanum]
MFLLGRNDAVALDSDVLDTYGEVKVKKNGHHFFKRTLKRLWQGKFKMADWAASSCNTSGTREHFVHELRKHIYVDVYGKCGDQNCSRSIACYRSLAKSYYYLSFENSICKDCVTEKLFKVLQYDIVPVVLGRVSYSRAAPAGSFMDALSFKFPKDLALYIKNVASDFILYSSFFKWKGMYQVKYWTYYTFCLLCRKLHSKSFR